LILADKHSGAVSPNSVDTHKQLIARTGGLMASLYTGRSISNVPDRDTCLEISQKLQRVLEDTLFKNLTLKVSIWRYFRLPLPFYHTNFRCSRFAVAFGYLFT
uniref:RT_RNaseH_2 domain-containing protein n=1 Tax=Echinostoma caproni TaxID=27848 RepID=A0A183A246_9TREM